MGHIAYTLPNIRIFKDNPYLKDLSKEEYEKINKTLEDPYDNEVFVDDEGYQWICKIVDGKITYESKEKELAEKNQKKFKKMFFGFVIFDTLFIIGTIILYIIKTRG